MKKQRSFKKKKITKHEEEHLLNNIYDLLKLFGVIIIVSLSALLFIWLTFFVLTFIAS